MSPWIVGPIRACLHKVLSLGGEQKKMFDNFRKEMDADTADVKLAAKKIGAGYTICAGEERCENLLRGRGAIRIRYIPI